MSSKKFRVAVLGATGAVGREMVSILGSRKFPLTELRLLASERSAGESLDFGDDELIVQVVKPESFKNIDLALFSAGGSVSKQWAPVATEQGAVVIDNTNAFRMDPDVPLVVPEVNPEALAGWQERRIVANPNCSTIQMVVALKPLHDAAHIHRVVVATYQAVSGAGQRGVAELEQQVRDLFNLREVKPELFPQRIAFNCLPCIPQADAFADDGSTIEELKMVNETRKILGDEVRVSATCVRVPVFNGHGEAVHIEFDAALSPERARELLSAAPGVMVLDNPANMLYPTQIEISGEDLVAVGRLRADPSVEHGLAMWVAADNLRKGAALNAVQIAELLASEHLV